MKHYIKRYISQCTLLSLFSTSPDSRVSPKWNEMCVSQKWMKCNERFTHFSTVDVKWNVCFYTNRHDWDQWCRGTRGVVQWIHCTTTRAMHVQYSCSFFKKKFKKFSRVSSRQWKTGGCAQNEHPWWCSRWDGGSHRSNRLWTLLWSGRVISRTCIFTSFTTWTWHSMFRRWFALLHLLRNTSKTQVVLGADGPEIVAIYVFYSVCQSDLSERDPKKIQFFFTSRVLVQWIHSTTVRVVHVQSRTTSLIETC